MKPETIEYLANLSLKKVFCIDTMLNPNKKMSANEFSIIWKGKWSPVKRGDIVLITLAKVFVCWAGVTDVERKKLCDYTDEEIREDTGLDREISYLIFEKAFGCEPSQYFAERIKFRVISRNKNEVLEALRFFEKMKQINSDLNKILKKPH